MNLRRYRPLLVGLLLFLLAILGSVVFSLYDQEILAYMRDYKESLEDDILEYPLLSGALYTIVFAVAVGLYLPGGIVLLLMAGALFPFWEANLYANLGNLAGATMGFLISRYFLFDYVQRNYEKQVAFINRGVYAHGGLYLFLLRVAPVLPSPVINLGMGMTPISLKTYMFATLAGRIPMTAIYVHLGNQLSRMESLRDLLSVDMIGALLAVCALVLAAKQVLRRYINQA